MSSDGIPVAFATILVKRVSNSSWVKGAITTEDGRFDVKKIVTGRYFVYVQQMSSGSLNSPAFDLTDTSIVDLGQLLLPAQMQELKQVTVNPTVAH